VSVAFGGGITVAAMTRTNSTHLTVNNVDRRPTY
jgi:hypothetical protein